MKVEEPAKPEPAKPEPAQPEPEADQPAATTAPSPDETPAKPQLTPDSVDDRLMDVVRVRCRATHPFALAHLHLRPDQSDEPPGSEPAGFERRRRGAWLVGSPGKGQRDYHRPGAA